MAEHRFRKPATGVQFSAPAPFRSDVAQVVAHSFGKAEVEASSASVGSISRPWPKTEAPVFQTGFKWEGYPQVAPFRGLRTVASIGRCQRSDTGSNPVDRSKVRGISDSGSTLGLQPRSRVSITRSSTRVREMRVRFPSPLRRCSSTVERPGLNVAFVFEWPQKADCESAHIGSNPIGRPKSSRFNSGPWDPTAMEIGNGIPELLEAKHGGKFCGRRSTERTALS